MYLCFSGDRDEEIARRQNIAVGCWDTTLGLIQDTLHEENHYIRELKTIMEHPNIQETIDDPGKRVVIKADRHTARYHRGVLNAPTGPDFAAVVSDEHSEGRHRHVQMHYKGGQLQYINELHCSYDPLQYPLILPNGQDGFDVTKKEEGLTKTTSMDFYAYQIQVRQDDFNTIHKLGFLFSQFLVDMYAKIEGERLAYMKRNQEALRAEKYSVVREQIQQDVSPDRIGTPVILPPSFVGGPRYMHNKTQDCLTYCRVYGKPHLFITMTCDANWPEIKNALFPGQTSTDREDLIARVFNEKRKKLNKAIVKDGLFGECIAYMATVEWQKRGLPHQHMIVWLAEDIHPRNIDDVICAEFPDPEVDKELFELVKKWMVHGPCGQRCQDQSGKCTKKFPRPFTKETKTNKDGYPEYRRRKAGDGGIQDVVIWRDSGAMHVYNNSHVVPYNPWLLRTFGCHINVENVAGIGAIKYVCKYVMKGFHF